ncbi:helix-turn-helix transcriptional regulator [Streptomyces sp. NPDC056697]|uniref:helix-turn-helix transcriptional regulator n=1 Tax=Streptomyces sp. NPDC056697 TaxID=3345915 RepID=UPI00369C6630
MSGLGRGVLKSATLFAERQLCLRRVGVGSRRFQPRSVAPRAPSQGTPSHAPIRDTPCRFSPRAGLVGLGPGPPDGPPSKCPGRPSTFTVKDTPMPARTSSARSTAPDSAGTTRRAFLNVSDAAEYLGLSPHTLYVWRHRRQGPPSFRMGPRGRVMYRVEALDAWVREQEQADSRSNPALNPLGVRPQERSARFTTV